MALAVEAMYPTVVTDDGVPLNAMNDYVIRITRDELPPGNAFWSLTLCDAIKGFFVPNEQKKNSAGENARMKLNEEAGNDIYVATEKPVSIPDENWLHIEQKDLEMNIILRVYRPDLEKMKTWKPPLAEKLKAYWALLVLSIISLEYKTTP